MSLRYSTIHHDVREQFKLTVADYMVIDSIHQLTNTSAADMSNVKRGSFLGLDESSVRAGKQAGEAKGLLFFDEKGCHTTSKWAEAVAFASGKSRETRENPEQTSGKSRDSIIIYTNKVNPAKADFQIEDETPPRAPKVSKLKSYDALIEWLRDLTGARIANVTKQYKWLKTAQQQGYDPGKLKEHALKMWDSSFWRANGMDWGNIVQDIDRATYAN